MVMGNILDGMPDADEENKDQQPQPLQQQDPMAGLQQQLGGALANNPVTTAQGQPDQPQNPAWQAPQPPQPQQGGGLLERGLGAVTDYLGNQSIPAVGPALTGVSAAANALGINVPDLGTLGGVFKAQNDASQQYGQALNQVPGYSSLPDPLKAGFQALPYAVLPGGAEGLVPRVATAFGSGVTGYGAQQGAAALGAGPVTQQAAGLLGGIIPYEGAGALSRANPVPQLDPLTPRVISGDWGGGSPNELNFEESLTRQANLPPFIPGEALPATSGNPGMAGAADNPYPFELAKPAAPAFGSPENLANMGHPSGEIPRIPEMPAEIYARMQAEPAPPVTSVYPPASQFVSPEHQAGYNQGVVDAQLLPPHDFQPTRGPDDTDFNMGYKEARSGLRPGELVNAPIRAPGDITQPLSDVDAANRQVIGSALPTAPGGGLTITQMIDAGLTKAQAEAAFAAGTSERVDATMTPAQAIDTQNAANAAWQRQSGSNPYQARGDGNNGGNARPPAPPGLDGNVWHNAMDLIGAPTRTLLLGLHTARFGPQEAMRPTVLGNGLRALGDAIFKGNAGDVIAHVNNDLGPNIPDGFRASDMRSQRFTLGGNATSIDPVANPRINPTYVSKAINDIPVLGPILQRLGNANSTFLNVMRDAHYNTAADRLARTVPDASPQMYRDLWREANNATGHSTLPITKGNSLQGGMGIGWGALTARAEELGNTIYGSGAPVPGLAAGSRAEAFKTLMGVAGTMVATTALAKALGADVNTSQPFNNFGLESTFLKPMTNNGVSKTLYGTGGAGYDTLFKAAANIGNDLFNNNQKAAVDHALAFARGEFGVVPSAVIDGILGQKWNGDAYSWQNFIDEAKHGFMTDENGQVLGGRSIPIAAGEIGKAVQAYGPVGALRAAPAAIASSVQTTPLTTGQASNYLVLNDPQKLAQAFPGQPDLQRILAGKPYAELLPTEKAAVKTVLDPQVLKNADDALRKSSPAMAAHGDTIDRLQATQKGTMDNILDQFNAHKLTGPQVRAAMKAANTDYYDAKGKADIDPAYVKELAGLKANGQDPTKAQNLLDLYYKIDAGDDYGKTRDLRAQFLAAVIKDDPQTGERLAAATQSHANESDLQKLYSSAQPVVDAVFSKQGGDRTEERRSHPDEDAILNFLGYESRTLTPAAETMLNQMRAQQGVKH